MQSATACAPGNIAIALHDGMRFAALQRFLRKQRSVDAAVHHPCAARSRHAPDLVSAQRIAGVHTDADDISGVECSPGTICSSDSSTRIGVPADAGVAAASTNSHRGVMTAVPKELSLGLTR